MSLPKIVVILGPTATGKSDLAVAMAKRFNGEVISADSRQVYKGLDLGSGKITKREMKGIPHHLLDVCSPKKVFSVSDYQKLALSRIEEILFRGKLPILCGGTGFYIQSIVEGIMLPEVPPNPALRSDLETYSNLELLSMLDKLDQDRARSIDPHNKVRLIRAIEVATFLGRVPKVEFTTIYDSEFIGLDMGDELLKGRIKKRLEKRMRQGMVAEVRDLHAKGLSWKRLESLGLEYRYLALYLQKKISKVEMLEKLNLGIWHYVKRQRTWFKRDKGVKWFLPKDIRRIEKEIEVFLKG